MNIRLLKSSLVCLAGALALAGCGSSSSGSTTATTPVPATSGTADTATATATTPSASVNPTAGGAKLTLQADPNGSLMFVQTSLKASAGAVTIDFENASSTPHNVTIKDSAGKTVGLTPTFMNGSRTLTMTLAKGTYTYFCSVPGHEQAGMKGMLTVS